LPNWPAPWFYALCFIIISFGPQPVALGAEQDRFLVGQFLVATPEMRDPRFAEAVIYMVKHDDTGAMGLVISKPLLKAPLDELLKGFGEKPQGSNREIVVHYGGPVAPRQGFFLHTDDVVTENTTRIADGVAMTSDTRLLAAMAQGKGPRLTLFMLGYAGWAPGQLEAEIKLNSWFHIPAEKALIFGVDADKKWRKALDKRKIPL
jgi:putative transcriptional regulator